MFLSIFSLPNIVIAIGVRLPLSNILPPSFRLNFPLVRCSVCHIIDNFCKNSDFTFDGKKRLYKNTTG
jgi:hypothetical protein